MGASYTVVSELETWQVPNSNLLPEGRQNLLRENVGLDVDDFSTDFDLRKVFVDGDVIEVDSEPVPERDEMSVGDVLGRAQDDFLGTLFKEVVVGDFWRRLQWTKSLLQKLELAKFEEGSKLKQVNPQSS